MAPGPFSKLPIEWLVQIFQWLPTQVLFQIMTTNRDWEWGARYVLKWRQSLQIDAWFRKENSEELTVGAVMEQAAEKLSAALPSLIKRMTNVKRLTVIGDYRREADVSKLLTSFPANLVHLDVYTTPWIFTAVVFPKLKQLWVNTFDAAAGVTCFPQLEYLCTKAIIHGSHENAIMPLMRDLEFDGFRTRLDDLHDFMTQNAKTLTRISIENSEGFTQDFDVIFEKLEVVLLRMDCNFASKCPALKSLTAWFQKTPITNLPVAQMKELEVVSCMEKSREEVFLSLVRRMVNLEKLYFTVQNLTDDVLLDLFSKTTQLEHVFIGIDEKFTQGHFLEWTRAIHRNNKNLKSLEFSPRMENEPDVICGVSQIRLRVKRFRITSQYFAY